MRASRELRARLIHAFGWWLEGLWLGVPASWRSRWFEARPRIRVRNEGQTFRFERSTDDTTQAEVEHLDRSNPQVAELLQSGDTEVILDADRAHCLIRNLSLPLAAERELRAVLRHELERLTPFSAEDIRFDYEILERDDSTGQIRVRLALIQREVLTELEQSLAGIDVRPQRATTHDSDDELLDLNWLPVPAQLRLPFARGPLRPAIAGLALLALTAALHLPLSRYQSLDAAFTNVANDSRATATSLRAVSDAQSAAGARAQFFAATEQSYISPLTVLAEITEAIPDTAWISRLNLNDQTITIQGEGVGASRLLEPIAALERIEQAEFQSPVSLNAATRRESFSIVATVKAVDTGT